MRERKWVLYLIALGIVIVSLYFYGLQYFNANDKIKNYILAQLRPILGESCDISQIHIGLGTVRFIDIDIPLPDEQFSITIDNIRIGFNIVKLLYRGINPQSISQDIVIEHPRLYINAAPPDTLKDSSPVMINYPDFAKIRETYSKQFQHLEILNRLSIIDGVIYYQVHDSLQVLLAHSIEGGFFTSRDDSLDLRVTGKLFTSNKENLSILARTHSKKGNIAFIKAKLQNYNLRDYMPEAFIPDLKFTSGEINGELDLVRKAANNKGFNLSGNIRVTDAAAEGLDKKIRVSELNLVSHIQDWNLIIDRATQKINETNVIVSGKVYNVVFPYLDLRLESPNINVENLQPLLFSSIGPVLQGQFSAVTQIKGPLTDLEIENKIHSPQMMYNSIPVKQVAITSHYHQQQLTIQSAQMAVFDQQVMLNGTIDHSHPQTTLTGSVDMIGDLMQPLARLGAEKLTRADMSFHADLSGQLTNPLIEGNGRITLASALDSTDVNIIISLQDKKINLDTYERYNGADINAELDLNTTPFTGLVNIQDVQDWILPYWNIPMADYLSRNMSLQTRISGNVEKFNINSQINHLDGGLFLSRWAIIDLNVENGKQIRGAGDMVLYPDSKMALDGHLRFNKKRNAFKLERFNLGDALTAELDVTKTESGNQLNGIVVAESQDLTQLINDADSMLTGILDMDVRLSGTLVHPQVNADLAVDNLVYEELGPYDANLIISVDSLGVKVPQYTLNSQDVTLLYAQGEYNALLDSLDFFVKGAGFDLGDVLRGRDNEIIVSGTTLVDVNVVGSKAAPRIAGKIAVKDGDIYDVPFDEIEVDLNPTQLKYPGLEISDFRLTRHGVYEINARGVYPFRDRDSLDIAMTGTGNFLQILSDQVGFFEHPQSNGVVQARVMGSPENPQLESASIKLENASMMCSSVIPQIDQLSAWVEFEPDDQFIHVHHLTGRMGEKPFNIYNQLAPVNASEPLEDIIIGDTGLNLGVIIPETPDKGIPLNISGLMEPDVYGNLELKGRDGEPAFYFAWIDDKPTFRGTIQLYDCEFMYPFYEGVSSPSNVVTSFFEHMEWNILVKPIQDVRYVKTFPGAIDNVYVNLQLNERYSQLDFSGQLIDESFRISGEVISTKGIIEYLGMDFRVDRAGAEFDRSSLEPVVYGNARTTIADSSGIPSQVYLTMQTHDVTMDKKQVDDIARMETTRGRWNDIRFKLSSDNPNFGSTESQLLSNLGYANVSLQQNPAIDAIGFGTENMILRPLIRPVEKHLERTLGLDYVRFSSMFTKNLLEFNLNNNLRVNNRLSLLKSTRLVVGKYIADKVFLQYTGQVESGIDYRYKDINVGLHHKMGLEYQINPRLLLELEYDYDSMIWQRENRDDKRIVLRHWFPF